MYIQKWHCDALSFIFAIDWTCGTNRRLSNIDFELINAKALLQGWRTCTAQPRTARQTWQWREPISALADIPVVNMRHHRKIIILCRIVLPNVVLLQSGDIVMSSIKGITVFLMTSVMQPLRVCGCGCMCIRLRSNCDATKYIGRADSNQSQK